MVGLEKELNQKNRLELRINHMCRHKSLIENPRIFDLNEIMARIWFVNNQYKIGFGGGGYAGGSADYKILLLLNMDFLRIFGSRFSFQGEFKLTDFENIFYEAELGFGLSKSTDIFLRNANTCIFDFDKNIMVFLIGSNSDGAISLDCM